MEVKFEKTNRFPCMYSISVREDALYLTKCEAVDLMKRMKEAGF